MSPIYLWLAVAGLTLLTVLTRSLFLLAGERVHVPARVQRALRYAPPAALVAIILPEIVALHGELSLAPLVNPRWPAGLAALLWFLYFRNMVSTIVVGMLVYTALRLYAG